MSNGIKVKVILQNNEVKYNTLPFGLRDAEIVGWLDDTYGGYGWKDYFII